jgi:hypothetical protein
MVREFSSFTMGINFKANFRMDYRMEWGFIYGNADWCSKEFLKRDYDKVKVD